MHSQEYIDPQSGRHLPRMLFMRKRNPLPLMETAGPDLQRVRHVLSAGNPDSGAGRGELQQIS